MEIILFFSPLYKEYTKSMGKRYNNRLPSFRNRSSICEGDTTSESSKKKEK